MSGPNDDRTELSSGARALIAAAREGDAPNRRDRVRVRRALAVAIAASAGTAGATGTAAASVKAAASTAATAGTGVTSAAGTAATATAATAGLFTKVAIAVVAIGVGSSAIVAVNHYASAPRAAEVQSASARATDAPVGRETTTRPGSTSRSVEEAPLAAIETAPVVEAPVSPGAIETETSTPVATAAPREAQPEATHRRAARAATVSADQGDAASLGEEALALRDAIARTTTPEQRFASIDVHAARFPRGQLASQRETARRRAIRDLCAAGPEAVAAFLAAHPSSSSAASIRETCTTDSQ